MPLDLLVSIREKRRAVHARSKRNCARDDVYVCVHRRGGWLIYETCIDRIGQFAFAGVQENGGDYYRRRMARGMSVAEREKERDIERERNARGQRWINGKCSASDPRSAPV